MAIKIEFDNTHNVLKPTLVLATRKGRKLGNIPAHDIVFKDCLNTYADFSFKVDKESCKSHVGFWDRITDFKLLWVREWNKWFEIYVEIDESNNTIKNISAKSLGEAELSQINLYNIEINTEIDIARDDYEPTVLYKGSSPNASLLTRISEKIPHYSIKHVDATIAGIQRTFSFDGKSIYDAFQQIASEINCLFIIDCYTNADGKIAREISVYDLESNCMKCGERGEFLKTCPKCGSTDITTGYGTDTAIFVSTDNLANDITFSTDNGSVKNCFKLEGGDDLMTATITNCNPNGSSYIWYISDDVKKDMSPELVTKLEKYDEDYDYYRNTYPANISGDILNAYNALVTKYRIYTDKYSTVSSPIIGYSKLMEVYYDTIDFYLYLNNSMMPSIEISETNAETEASKLRASNLSPTAVRDLSVCSNATADSSVLAYARTIINNRYQVKIKNSSFSGSVWKGIFTVTSYSDDEDTAETNTVTITIDDNYERYVKQKIDRALRQSTTNDEITDIVDLFDLDDNTFKNELKKYSLSRLTSFHDSCQTCLDVLTEQGVGNNSTWASSEKNLYKTLYVPYYNKLGYIESEMKLRENEIAIIIGTYDSNDRPLTDGLQTLLDKQRNIIHDYLDFESYLGTDLWLEFSAYRREDTYKNENYISDGLNNSQLFENARKFIAIAEKEIYKSATLQHSISATLKNLLVMKEFEPIVNFFEVGNWIRIRVDDKIYRLRLLDYEIDFNDLDNLSITFSDVTIVSGGQSDVGSVLDQASSIASSYDTTKRQAETSKNRLDDWVQKGLDATNVKIMSNADNQNQTWDSHGMLFRQYDAITDSYDDTQLKILNSTLAVTDDNWKSIKTAVGGFYYYDPVTGALKYGYGINGELVIGKVILGEQLGIYTDNNSMTFDKNGLVIKNDKNTFTVNPNSSNLLVLSNSTDDILWADNKGNLTIRGTLDGCDGLFSGSLQVGGSTAFRVDTEGNLSIGGTSSNPNFYVSKDGIIKANEGTFSGTVSGATITGSTINGSSLIGGSINIGDGKFYVGSDGNVKMTGSITWGTNSSPIRVLYARTKLSKPNTSYENYYSNNSYDWHRTLSVAYDFYISYSYDGGQTWTEAMKLQGEDGSNGQDGQDGVDGSDATVTRGNIARALYEYSYDYYNDGIYSYYYNGRYYLAINASYILAGDIDADNIALTCGYGGFSKGYGSTGAARTYGSMMYGSNGKGAEPYIMVTNAGARMTAQNSMDFYCVAGGLHAAEEIQVGSDRRIKNSIEYDLDKYESFFMSLKPTQYKLNNGVSGRYHLGFIAQDVESALLENNMTTLDFAGVCVEMFDEGFEKDGISNGYYRLRYGEFISLNTFMIQKLYKKIEGLEKTISDLKGESKNE